MLSPAIAVEVLRALASPKVQKFIRGDLDAALWFEDILVLADFVADAPNVAGVRADPDDDKYVAAALEGRAGFIVTGDRQLLALGQYEDVRIVSPRAFLEISIADASPMPMLDPMTGLRIRARDPLNRPKRPRGSA